MRPMTTDAGIPLGPFQLDKRLGVGGMGEVWRAVHRGSGTAVAIKFLTHSVARRRRYRAAFHHEVRSVAGLDHPNIVSVLDAGQVPQGTARRSEGKLVKGSPFLVMELAPGGSLEDLEERMPWKRLYGALLQILAGLGHAHARGVVHRDLKPGNVLVSGDTFLLADFGIAHGLTLVTQAEAGLVSAGTWEYMPPEQVLGEWRDYGPWTDLYALGCVAWQLVAGRAPFAGGDVVQIADRQLHAEPPDLVLRPDMPPGLDEWLRRLLAKDPGARFPVAAAAADALRALADDSPPRPSWKRDVPPPTRLPGLGVGLYGLRAVRLVDREPAREALWSALEQVRDEGKARLVVLRGPTGVGKTRLASWMIERAHEVGLASALTALHSPGESPGDGLPGMIRRRVRCTQLDPEPLQERTRAWLKRRGGEELTEALVEIQLAMGNLAFDDPSARHAICRTFLELVSQNRPVVLFMDDVQWGADALDFALSVIQMREVQTIPVLMVLTASDEAIRHRAAESQRLEELLLWAGDLGTTLQVDALSPADTSILVRGLLGLEPTLAAKVEDRVNGNPLFAVHLVGDWVQRRLLRAGRRGLELTPGAEISLPDDLSDVWTSHLDRLLASRPPRDGIALEIAAALGRRVENSEWIAVCRKVCGQPPAPALLDILVDHQLAQRAVDAPLAAWSFVHGMLRETLQVRSKQAGRWADHNLACATVLGDLLDSARLGRFLFAGGAYRDSLSPLLDAATASIYGGGNPQSSQVLLAEREEAMRRLHLPESDPQWAEGWLLLATMNRIMLNIDESSRWILKTETAAAAHDWDGVWPRVFMAHGRNAARRREVQRSLDLLVAAESLYRDRGDFHGAVDSLNAQSRMWLLTDCSKSITLTIEAMEILGEHPDQAQLATTQLNLGDAYFMMGDNDAAEAALMNGLELHTGHSRTGQADALRCLGKVAARRGDYDKSMDLFERAYRAIHAWAAPDALADLANSVGEIARRAGDLDTAETKYREALALYSSVGIVNHLPEANLGLVLLARGDYEPARLVLDAALQGALKGGSGWVTAFHTTLLPCVVDDEEAWNHHYGESSRLLEAQRFADTDIAWVAETAARRAVEYGHPDRARQAWALAADQWTALGETDKAAMARKASVESPAVG